MRHGHASSLARSLVNLSIVAVLLTLPQFAEAKDEVEVSGDVTATGGYSNNPFSIVGSDTGSAYAQIRAAPDVKLAGETSTFDLSGLVNYQHYFRLYNDTEEYRAALDYVGRPSSRLTTHANVKYDNSIIGSYDSLSSLTTPTQSQPAPTTGTDLALFGSEQRRRDFESLADASYLVTPHDTVAVNGFYDVVRYGGLNSQSNYDGYGGGANYSRQISAGLHVGASASVSRYVYQGLLGNSQIYSGAGTITDQLSGYWSLQGSLGASYSDRTIGGKATYLSGNLNLCRTTDRATFCVNARRAVLPTGISTSITFDAGTRYSYRLTEKSTLTLTADYLSNGGQAGLVDSGRYYTTALNFERRLKERIRLTATTRYRRITGDLGGRAADYAATLGVDVRFGETND